MKYTLHELTFKDLALKDRDVQVISLDNEILYMKLHNLDYDKHPMDIWLKVTGDKNTDEFIRKFLIHDEFEFESELVKFMTYDEMIVEMI